jgi:uncharacterized alkaline shock family protein YloU
MAQKAEKSEASTNASDESPKELARRDEGKAASDRGRTVIDDAVVAKVAGMAAREVPGVHQMGAAPARAVSAMTQRVGIADGRGQGVGVEVGERQAAADLTLVIEYGESIQRVADRVRENVIRRIEAICGLEVTEVNIVVNDLHFPGDDDEGPEHTGEARVE